MVYLFQFSCFFSFSLILFIVFVALWKNRVIAFYSSFLVGLIGFFASLRNLHESTKIIQQFGFKYSASSNVFIGEYDVLSRFIGLILGLFFISIVFYFVSSYSNFKNKSTSVA